MEEPTTGVCEYFRKRVKKGELRCIRIIEDRKYNLYRNIRKEVENGNPVFLLVSATKEEIVNADVDIICENNKYKGSKYK